MKRVFLVVLALSVLVVPISALGMGGYAEMPSSKPVVNRAEGPVGVKAVSAPTWQDAKVGMLLDTGDSVRTGEGGRAEILHAGGAIRLFPNSLLVVPDIVDAGGNRAVRQAVMEEGDGLFRVSPGGIKNGFEVKTLQVIAGVKGTVFSVTARGKRTRVAVYRGIVEVTDPKRTPSTLTRLTRGQYVEIEDGKGFGIIKGFTPGDAWGGWFRDREPRLDDPRPDRLDFMQREKPHQLYYRGNLPTDGIN